MQYIIRTADDRIVTVTFPVAITGEAAFAALRAEHPGFSLLYTRTTEPIVPLVMQTGAW